MRALTVTITLCWMAAGASEGVSLPKTGDVERLPISGMLKVTEADGSVKYLSEDRRFVFVGTMYDLWQGEAMTAGVAVSKKLDWDRNGVSIDKIGLPIGGDYGDTALFIAPECEDCRALLSLALEKVDGPMSVVLLASSKDGHEKNAMVWCSKNPEKTLVDVYIKGEKPRKDDMAASCDRFGLMLAEQASMLFGIGQLPMFVDAEGNGHTGENAIYAISD